VASISNLFIDQGANYSNILTVAGSGGVINLANYTIKSQLRKSYGSSSYFNFNATIYDAPTGRVRLQLSAEESSAIPPGKYLYDVELTNTVTGIKIRLVEGIVIITPEITKT
jgi:hypothetical protein